MQDAAERQLARFGREARARIARMGLDAEAVLPVLAAAADTRQPALAKLLLAPPAPAEAEAAETAAAADLRAGYEALPYPSVPVFHARPQRLAAIARLHGLPAPALRRILVPGCGEGGNLLAIAAAHPEAEVTGIDLSGRQVAQAGRLAAAAGLANVRLVEGSFVDLGPALGPFDAIVAHGLWSWVPEDVGEALLALCGRALAPDGIAYVSFNVLPGWHLRGAVRALLRQAAAGIADAAAQVAAARAALEAATGEGAWADVLADERARVARLADGHLAHDLLEPVNRPAWLGDFVARAAAHGLAYLADANVAAALPQNQPAALQPFLAGLEPAAAEELVDLRLGRSYRAALLVRASGPIRRDAAAWDAGAVRVAGRLEPGESADGAVRFRSPEGTVVAAREAPAVAALEALAAAWPASLDLDGLAAAVAERLGRRRASHRMLLRELMAAGLARGVLEPSCGADPFVTRVSGCPEASPLARAQAAEGPMVATLDHRSLRVEDAVTRYLLRHLDGRRDRAGLVALLARARRDGAFDLPDGMLAPALDYALASLAGAALLRAQA